MSRAQGRSSRFPGASAFSSSSHPGTSGFGGFSSTQTGSGLSYLTEPPDFSSISDANVGVAFKNLLKKDATTKTKALEELVAYVRAHPHEQHGGPEEAILEAWVQVYPRISIDNARRARELSHTLQFELMKSARKRMEKRVPKVVGTWLAGTTDKDRAVANAASQGLSSLLTNIDKVLAFWKKCQPQILTYSAEAIRETKDTLSDERSTTADDAEAKYFRVVNSSLSLVLELLQKLEQADLDAEADSYDIFFSEDVVWKSATFADSAVRKVTCELLWTCLEKRHDSVASQVSRLKKIFVTEGLKSNQTGSAVDDKKTPISRLQIFLEKGSQGSSVKFWGYLEQLLAVLPTEQLTHESASDILGSLRVGIASRGEPRINAPSAWTCYVRAARHFLTLLPPDGPQSQFLLDHIFPLISHYLKPTTETTGWDVGGKPEVSKDYEKSQDAVAQEGDRWFLLVGQIHAKIPAAHQKAQVLDGPSKDIVFRAVELLANRNLKPIVQEALTLLGRDKQHTDNAVRALEMIASRNPAQLSRDDTTHMVLITSLLGLAELDDSTISSRANTLRSLIDKPSGGKQAAVAIIRRNLEDANQQSLGIETLCDQAIQAAEGGDVAIKPEDSDEQKRIRRDREGRSIPARMALYTAQLLASQINLQGLLPSIKDVYGPHWERTIEFCTTLWSKAASDDLEDAIPYIHASLRLMNTLESISEPNDDLVDAIQEAAENKSRALLTLLEMPREKSTQPLEIIDGLICRQVEKIPLKHVADLSDLYGLVSSESRDVQTAAFSVLHRSLPAKQEQLSIDVLLEKSDARLPDELLSLLLEAPTLEKYSDEVLAQFPTAIRSYLLTWCLVFDAYSTASLKVRNDYTEHLKTENYVGPLMEFTFDVLGHSAAHALNLDREGLTIEQIRSYDLKVADSEPEEKNLHWLLVHLYYLTLKYIPGLFRAWYIECRSKQTKIAVEAWMIKYFSPLIISEVLDEVAVWASSQEAPAADENELVVKVSPTAKEITAGYEVDESLASIAIRVPAGYPLEGVNVVGLNRVAVNERKWQSWLMTTQGVITFSNGSIIDGLTTFRRNIVGALKGQSECAICYSIISTDKKMPDKKCSTCKNLFHRTCLYKWFQSSNQNTCPLCRNPIDYLGSDVKTRRAAAA
ncbi:E3 ubiquitin-protein ligase listerin like [Verticillium longisporum]|nr:E3 ubiquitin-protein ligase listerin like [Verticillium longisporum]